MKDTGNPERRQGPVLLRSPKNRVVMHYPHMVRGGRAEVN